MYLFAAGSRETGSDWIASYLLRAVLCCLCLPIPRGEILSVLARGWLLPFISPLSPPLCVRPFVKHSQPASNHRHHNHHPSPAPRRQPPTNPTTLDKPFLYSFALSPSFLSILSPLKDNYSHLRLSVASHSNSLGPLFPDFVFGENYCRYLIRFPPFGSCI